MIELHEIIGLGLIPLGFIFLIVGTFLKWDFLVDPPESRKGYSHTYLKRLFGKEFLTPYNYIVGTIGSIFGIYMFISFLKQYLQQN